jgi:transaldolase
LGRIDDTAQEGIDLVKQIVTIYSNYHLATEVLAASIRGPLHVTQAALAGAHCATLPIGVIRQLIKHPLTDAGLDRFLADARKAAERAK